MARSGWSRDDSAVTPVVGTLLIMGITVAGIAAILFWGTPTIQAIQDQNAAVAMTGEFEDLRLGTLELTIPDASRVPRVPVGDGTLALQQGTRMAIHVVYSAGGTGCGFHVTGWESTSVPTDVLDVAAGSCGTTPLVDVYRVTGNQAIITVEDQSVGAVDVDQDVTTGGWRVVLKEGGSSLAEAWIMGTDQVAWSLQTSVSDLSIILEGGAIFQQDDGTLFLIRDPALREDAFATGDHVFRLPTFDAASYQSVSGRSTTTVFLGLLGHHLRVSTDDAVALRYSFHGGLAEGWCNGILLRSSSDWIYSQDPNYRCDGTAASGIRSVTYGLDASAAGYPIFPFELFQDRIHVFLQV